MIGEIPAIIMRPKEVSSSFPTIIFYHGWSSDKESQRFRGFILSSLGYQVVVPDAIYHGERNKVDHKDPKIAEMYFWPTILNNIQEASSIINYMVDNFDADPHRFGVAGNSMGGFTTAGVFTHNKNIKSAVVYNGSCNWNHSNTLFKNLLNVELTQGAYEEIEDKIDKLDPMNNLELLVNRPILLLHGDKDSLVSIESQRIFYNKVFPLYEEKDKIRLIEYPNLNHFVTTNMMEETSIWFNKFL